MVVMERLKNGWFRVPRGIRRPIVIIVGFLFVISAGLTGWIPGPGGIPLFLLGIAILASEYEWANRLKNFVLKIVLWFSRQFRAHPVVGGFVILTGIGCAALIGYASYIFVSSL